MNILKNRVQLIGNLGVDPKVINFENGKKLAKFSLATNEPFINKQGEKTTNTQWHQIIVWGKTATVAENYLRKGSEVAIEGRLVYSTYEDKEGVKRHSTEISATNILMFGKSNTSDSVKEIVVDYEIETCKVA